VNLRARLHVLDKINISLPGIELRSSVAQRSHCTKVTTGGRAAALCFLVQISRSSNPHHETSVNKCQHTLRNIPEERRLQPSFIFHAYPKYARNKCGLHAANIVANLK